MKSLAPLSHQCRHDHSEKRPLPDLVERFALLASTLRLPSSTRLTGHRMTTYSLRLLEYQNLRRFSLSSRFVPQPSVSWRLAPFQTLCSPILSAWYLADGRCPRPHEAWIDLRSFSGPSHSSWPLLQTNYHPSLTALDLHCHGQLGFPRHHLLHDLSTSPASGTNLTWSQLLFDPRHWRGIPLKCLTACFSLYRASSLALPTSSPFFNSCIRLRQASECGTLVLPHVYTCAHA